MYNEPDLSNLANTRIEYFENCNNEYDNYLIDAMVEGKEVEIIEVHEINPIGYRKLDKDAFWDTRSMQTKEDLTVRLISEYESNLDSSYTELQNYKKMKRKKAAFDDEYEDEY